MKTLPKRKNQPGFRDPGGSFYHPSSSHLVGPLNEWCNGPAQSSSKRNFEKLHEHTGILLSGMDLCLSL